MMKINQPTHEVKLLNSHYVFAMIYLWPLLLSGQGIIGSWQGVLDVGVQKLTLEFHINECGTNCYHGYMDSPDQSAEHIPVSDIDLLAKRCKISIDAIGAEYYGMYNGSDSINGTFKQSGYSFPLNLHRITEVENEMDIPVIEKEYLSEEIHFFNEHDSTLLAGVLTYPMIGDRPSRAVVLINGSGPQDRDYNIFGHKLYLTLSDYLTKAGIAVLRFDDRGVGKSSGEFKNASTLDFSLDVSGAIKYLKLKEGIDTNRIGLIGHSEGGLIAMLLASDNTINLNQITLLATPSFPGDIVLLDQQAALLKSMDIHDDSIKLHQAFYREVFDIVKESNQEDEATQKLKYFLHKKINHIPSTIRPKHLKEDEFIELMLNQFCDPWMSYLLQHDPRENLKNINCPVLAIAGDKDIQVQSSIHLPEIRKILTKNGNKEFIVKEIKNVNHLLQECETGYIAEYKSDGQVFSQEIIVEIVNWI